MEVKTMILRKIPVQEGEQYYDYGVYCGKYEFVSTCDVCGQEFQHAYRHAKYCSERCVDLANIQSRKAYRQKTNAKICEHCRESFQATRIDSLFCSAACLQANHRDKQKREPREQTNLYVIKFSRWHIEKLIKQLNENNVKVIIGFQIFSDTELRLFSQANIKCISIKELEVPNELHTALYKKEITQAQCEAKYKKHLPALKLRIEFNKTDSIALITTDYFGYQDCLKKCYTSILPEFMKGVLGLSEVILIEKK
jgi:hypothetical protein